MNPRIVVGVSAPVDVADRMREAAKEKHLSSVSDGWVQAAELWLSQDSDQTQG
jgi:hypothetical protein